MWLAKHAMMQGDFQRAYRLATELCQDGVDVEEAKALVRDARSRLGTGGEATDGGIVASVRGGG